MDDAADWRMEDGECLVGEGFVAGMLGLLEWIFGWVV